MRRVLYPSAFGVWRSQTAGRLHPRDFGEELLGARDMLDDHVCRGEVERPRLERQALDIALHAMPKTAVFRQRVAVRIDADADAP